MDVTKAQLLGSMDVAMLDPTTTEAQIRGLAEATLKEGYGFVCVHSSRPAPATARTRSRSTRTCG